MQALSFDLFSPLIDKDTGDVHPLLPNALGVRGDNVFKGCFGKVFDEDESTRFDFCIEGENGKKVFCDLKSAHGEFGSCTDDEEHLQELERHYRPFLIEHVDARWLEKPAFCRHYEILRKLSYLGRYSNSGLAFIFPKADRKLGEAEEAIKQIVSKTLAPRVAILHVEYLLARLLTLTADDAALHEHFLKMKEKYVPAPDSHDDVEPS
jgi:hypothetical protein